MEETLLNRPEQRAKTHISKPTFNLNDLDDDDGHDHNRLCYLQH